MVCDPTIAPSILGARSIEWSTDRRIPEPGTLSLSLPASALCRSLWLSNFTFPAAHLVGVPNHPQSASCLPKKIWTCVVSGCQETLSWLFRLRVYVDGRQISSPIDCHK